MIPILEIQELHRKFGRIHALRGINLELPGPGVYGFLGPNGAGKTTTIKLIAGLIRPTSGTVHIAGVDIQADPVTALRRTGVMMETPQFYTHLSGRNNLRVLARLSGNHDDSCIAGLLDRVGLRAKANEKVASYSRGMRQRLGLAAALLDDPKLVVLDEPTNGLDPTGMVEMRQWLLQMARDEGRTILLSSHQMGEVERICDSVTIITQGVIVASGRTDELAQPKHAVMVKARGAQVVGETIRGLSGVDCVEMLGPDQIRIESRTLSSTDINKILMNHGIDVIEIRQEKETLEEIFFRLVGEQHDVA